MPDVNPATVSKADQLIMEDKQYINSLVSLLEDGLAGGQDYTLNIVTLGKAINDLNRDYPKQTGFRLVIAAAMLMDERKNRDA